MRNFFRFLSSKPNKLGGLILCASAAGVYVSQQPSKGGGNLGGPPSTINLPLGAEHSDKSPIVHSAVKLPEVKIARKIPSLIDEKNRLDLRLYQFQTCPFCCKVRAFFDYYGFGYEVVEVNSVLKREIKFSEYKKVPIVVAKGWHGRQLNDSSFIISFLRSFFIDPDRSLDEVKSYYPIFVYKDEGDSGKEDNVVFENDNKYFVMFNEKLKTKQDINSRKEEREWRRWVDETLVHTISPNIYRTLGESLATFKWFSTNGNWEEIFPFYERLFVVYVGALVMYFVADKLRRKHHLKIDVRESLYDACKEWTHAIGPNRRFMGGDRPNLADLAVYGAMTSFEGCQAFQDVLDQTNLGPWFKATKEAVLARQGASEFGKEIV